MCRVCEDEHLAVEMTRRYFARSEREIFRGENRIDAAALTLGRLGLLTLGLLLAAALCGTGLWLAWLLVAWIVTGEG